MENYIKGLIYAHKEELTNIGIGTPHERRVRDNLISRIKELESILAHKEKGISQTININGGFKKDNWRGKHGRY